MMRKIIAFFLVLVLVFSLAACGNRPVQEGDLTGEWKLSLDFKDSIKQSMSGQGLEEAVNLIKNAMDHTPLILSVNITFQEDGTFTMKGDEESLDALIQTLIDLVFKVWSENAHVFMNMTKEEYEKKLKEEGVTQEQVIASIQSVLTPEMIKSLFGMEHFEFEGSGEYKVAESKLYFNSDTQSAIQLEWQGNNIMFKSIIGTDENLELFRGGWLSKK